MKEGRELAVAIDLKSFFDETPYGLILKPEVYPTHYLSNYLVCSLHYLGETMPAKRTTMRKIRDVVQLRLFAGLSIRQINASTKLSIDAVQKMLTTADELEFTIVTFDVDLSLFYSLIMEQ